MIEQVRPTNSILFASELLSRAIHHSPCSSCCYCLRYNCYHHCCGTFDWRCYSNDQTFLPHLRAHCSGGRAVIATALRRTAIVMSEVKVEKVREKRQERETVRKETIEKYAVSFGVL